MAEYDGRPLPRPDAELVDQGLGFDLDTMIGRRQILSLVGLGAGVVGLAACGGSNSSGTSSGTGTSASGTTTSGTTTSAATSSAATTSSALSEIPDETAGPYPGDGSNGPDVLADSGVVRADIRSSFGSSSTTAQGIPLTIELDILDLTKAGAGFAGVAVYVWHCDREGRYSLYSDGVTGENYLRGVQVAGSDGKVSFTSIFPACYTGRWPHIHFEVYPSRADITDAGNAIATSQIALPKATCDLVYATSGYESSVSNLSQLSLETDMVFGNDGAVLQLGTVTGDVTKGFTVALRAGVDTSTTPSRA